MNKTYHKEYYQKHKEERLEYGRQYRSKPGAKEKRRVYQKQYRQRPKVKECNRLLQIKWQKDNPDKYLYRAYKYSAKQRKLDFSLTFEQFMIFWQKPCYYCGNEMKTIGLDRVDNKKGYTLENIVSCCWCCNDMKKAKSQVDFLNNCRKIVKLHF